MSDKFKKIDDLNETLVNIRENAIKTLTALEADANVSREALQKKVDDVCIRFSQNVNKKLDKQRTFLITVLHQGYLSSNEVISLLQPIVEANVTDLGSVINLVKKIQAFYTKPYQTAVEFITILTPKLTELSTNIVALGAIPSYIPEIEGINFNKLNITMKPITIDNIISGKS